MFRARTTTRFWKGLCATAALAAAVACAPPTLPHIDDGTPPQVQIQTPGDGSRVETFTPSIGVDYADPGAGIDVTSFLAQINGEDYSAEFDHYVHGAVGDVSPTRPIPLGRNRLVVNIADRNGNHGRDVVEFINAAGGWLHVMSVPGSRPARHVEIVLDASGSMSHELGLETRMQVAKSALRDLVESVPGGTQLGLRAFRDCRDIDSIVKVQPVRKDHFIRKVEEVRPGRDTPIVEALLESFAELSRFEGGQRTAVLVTDGLESCGGKINDVAVAARETRTRVVVIGLDITDPAILNQLTTLAESSGGVYVDARNPEALVDALERSLLLTYRVFDASGREVGRGEVDGAPAEVPAGVVDVRLDTAPAVRIRSVAIGKLTDTRVDLSQRGRRIESKVGKPIPATVF